MATADGKQCSIFDAAAQHLIIPDVRCGGLRVVGPTKLWANGEHGAATPRPSQAKRCTLEEDDDTGSPFHAALGSGRWALGTPDKKNTAVENPSILPRALSVS